MISTRSVGLLIDTVVCLTLAKWETVSGRFGGYFTGTLVLEKNGPRLSGLGCQRGEIKAGLAPTGSVVLTVGVHTPPGAFIGVWHVDQANGDVSFCAQIPNGNSWYCGVANLPH